MTEREGTQLICALGPIKPAIDLPGTTTDVCAECGREILVAPSGRDLQQTMPPPVTLVCIDCGIANIQADPEPTVLEPTSEQLDELARHRERRAG